MYTLGVRRMGRGAGVARCPQRKLVAPALGMSPGPLGAFADPWFLSGVFQIFTLFSQFSRSSHVNSSRPHGPQHARPPCPSPTPGVYSEFTQTHVHRVGDAIQPSHPLSSPSPPAPNPSKHQGLFQQVSSLHQVARVLEFQLQHQSFQ